MNLENYIDYGILLIGYCSIFLISKYAKLGFLELNLNRTQLKNSLKPILGMCAIIAIVFISVSFIDSSVFENSKFDQNFLSILIYIFLLLPVQVVLFEELLFCGLILTSFEKLFGFFKSAIISSILFGIWHVLS